MPSTSAPMTHNRLEYRRGSRLSTGSLIAYVQETLLLLSSDGEWGWEDWQRWEICTAIWKERDNLRLLGADRIIKIIIRILYKYGVTRSNSLYFRPEVNIIITKQGPWEARTSLIDWAMVEVWRRLLFFWHRIMFCVGTIAQIFCVVCGLLEETLNIFNSIDHLRITDDWWNEKRLEGSGIYLKNVLTWYLPWWAE